MTSLRVGEVEVARYDWDTDPPPTTVARPSLHPLRTLAATVVTAAHPADHPWHRGMGVALPDIGGANLWGGPTYQAGSGYHDTPVGTVRQASTPRARDDEIFDALTWCDSRGVELLHETRQISARGWADECWCLEWSSVLTSATGGAVRLGSPGSNGRPGAGYGGFFWRLADLDPAQVCVFTADAEGEDAVNGSRADWLAITAGGHERGWTAILAATDERTAADPWFVRVRQYIGIGSALAWHRPLILPAGEHLRIALRVLLLDRVCHRSDVSSLLVHETDGARP